MWALGSSTGGGCTGLTSARWPLGHPDTRGRDTPALPSLNASHQRNQLGPEPPQAMSETYLSRKITPMQAPKSTMQDRSGAGVKDAAGSTRWPQAGPHQPPRLLPTPLGSRPLDGTPRVSRDGPGPRRGSHCWDQAEPSPAGEAELGRNGPTGTAKPGTPAGKSVRERTHSCTWSRTTEPCAHVRPPGRATPLSPTQAGVQGSGQGQPSPPEGGSGQGSPTLPGGRVGAPGGGPKGAATSGGRHRRLAPPSPAQPPHWVPTPSAPHARPHAPASPPPLGPHAQLPRPAFGPHARLGPTLPPTPGPTLACPTPPGSPPHWAPHARPPH